MKNLFFALLSGGAPITSLALGDSDVLPSRFNGLTEPSEARDEERLQSSPGRRVVTVGVGVGRTTL